MATLLKPAAALSTESPPFNPRVAGSIGSNGISGAMGGGSASAGAQPDNSNSNAIAKHTFSYNGCVMTIGITYMIINVPFKPSRIVTSEGYLVVFVWSFPALHLQLALRCASRLNPNRSPSHILSHMPTTTRTTDTKYKPCVGQSNS